MQARKISIALIGSSKNIYDFITTLNPGTKQSIVRSGRVWKEISVPTINETDKSWSCFNVKINDIEYVIHPRSNENFKDYLEHFYKQNEYAKTNEHGFKYPASFLWSHDKVIFCDVPEHDQIIAKVYCNKANLPFVNYTPYLSPEECLSQNGKPARETLFGSPIVSTIDIKECNLLSLNTGKQMDSFIK